MMAPFSLDAIAQAQVARIAALLTMGTAIAVAGALAFRLSSRSSAAVRYCIAIGVFGLLLLAGIRPEPAMLTVTGQPALHSVYVSPLWSRVIFAGWAVIAFIGLIRVAAGVWRVRQLKHEAARMTLEALPNSVGQSLAEARRFGRSVEILASESIKVPAAVGFLRPAVVLPSWMVNTADISPDDLHALVLHELAHIRRYDDWVNLAQKVVTSILFFHPAAWWLDRRIAAEREMACDDAVVRSAKDPQRYAECLVRMAEHSYLRRTLALAQAAVGQVRLTTIRVKRLLSANRAPASGWKAAVTGTALACVGLVVAISPAPRLITFTRPYVATLNSNTTDSSNVILARSTSTAVPHAISGTLPLRSGVASHAHQPSRVHVARHTQTAPNNSYWLVVETRQQVVGNTVIQTQTWRVVMVSSPPAARRATPNKQI